jgi:hypothetical protein
VSAIVRIKTLAGDLPVGADVPSFESLLMYFYTIAKERRFYQMPRRNKPAISAVRRTQPTSEATKRRFATKQAAKSAAKERMRYHENLQLSVYQSPHDGGWYLTSRQQS